MVSLGLKDVYSRIDRSRDESIAGLFEFLSQPSISTLGVGIEEMSSLLATRLRQLGFRTRVIKGAGHPFVYGEQRARNGANSPTVLIYGHYDVQPVEPLDAWKSDPFKPAVRDGRIYARGAGDNKGQLYAQLMGIKALSDVRGGLPLNVKCIFEGEEENGSPNLEGFVKENKELLRADLVYTSDGPLHESGRPMLVFGVRGLLYVELTATGANRDLHSGNWGGPIPNPAWDLVRLLGTMKDERGRVRIEGFYERVRRPTPSERAAFRRIPLDKRSVGRSLGLKSSSLPDSEEFYRRLMAEPTLNICGIYGGYTGRGSKTVIPSSASVKMDMRLVPDQDPEDIFRKLARHVRKHRTGNIQIKKMSTSLPSRTSLDIRFAAPIAEAVMDATGMEPVIYPSLGATLPDYVFTRVLGVPSIIVPYANIDESNHAPNENIKVENFVMGMKCAAAVLESLSRVRST